MMNDEIIPVGYSSEIFAFGSGPPIVVGILALQPTHAQLEEAAAKTMAGAEKIFAERGSEDLVLAQIVELAGADLDGLGE